MTGGLMPNPASPANASPLIFKMIRLYLTMYLIPPLVAGTILP
jgi:hypothetical protein